MPDSSAAPSLDQIVLQAARVRLCTELPLQIQACLDALDTAQIWWRPNEKANSVGTLVLHLCGSLRFFISRGVGEIEFTRDRDAEFADHTPLPRAVLKARFEAAINEADAVLTALDPGQLATVTDRTGKTLTYAQIILQVLAHLALHTGQIVYVTKMLEAGAIDELWMKTRRQ